MEYCRHYTIDNIDPDIYKNVIYQKLMMNLRDLIIPNEPALLKEYKKHRIGLYKTRDGSGFDQYLHNIINAQAQADWKILGKRLCEEKWKKWMTDSDISFQDFRFDS